MLLNSTDTRHKFELLKSSLSKMLFMKIICLHSQFVDLPPTSPGLSTSNKTKMLLRLIKELNTTLPQLLLPSSTDKVINQLASHQDLLQLPPHLLQHPHQPLIDHSFSKSLSHQDHPFFTLKDYLVLQLRHQHPQDKTSISMQSSKGTSKGCSIGKL